LAVFGVWGVFLTSCGAGSHRDALDQLTDDVPAGHTMETAYNLGRTNSMVAASLGCGQPDYLTFTAWQDEGVHLLLKVRTLGDAVPLTIEVLDPSGASLYSRQERASVRAPSSSNIEFTVPYAALGTTREAAQGKTYGLRFTVGAQACRGVRFAIHFPDPPLPY
jgi:hypothetical protein